MQIALWNKKQINANQPYEYLEVFNLQHYMEALKCL